MRVGGHFHRSRAAVVHMDWNSAFHVLRSIVGLPAIVLLWTGIWDTLDFHLPWGFALWKEIAFVFIGLTLLVATGTLFSNAGLERVHAEPEEPASDAPHVGHWLWVHGRALVAVLGSVTFWCLSAVLPVGWSSF